MTNFCTKLLAGTFLCLLISASTGSLNELSAQECTNWQVSHPDWIFCDDFETSPAPSGLPDFSIYELNGIRCGGTGRSSDCSYSNIIAENNCLPPYPTVSFPMQNKTTFVYYEEKVPENFFTGRGSHGYYVFDSTNNIGSVVIDPEPENTSFLDFEWDLYTKTVLRGSSYQRMVRSFEGFEPKQRGEWHSYQLMIVPSNLDPNVGILKLWIDGELSQFAKTDTIPKFDTFWITNYWHSLEYIPKDQFDNFFEAYTAPFHPAFDVSFDNLIISQEYVEVGNSKFQIERVKFSNLSTGSFTVHFDTTVKSTSKVEWGETTAYGSKAENTTPGYFHSINVSGLQPSKTYYMRISAVDNDGRTVTDNYSFNTNGAIPGFSLPDWQGEVYQNTNLSGTPVFIRNFKDLSYVSWAGPNSDDVIRTDQPMSVRYKTSRHFTAGNYTFRVATFDGVRVSVDGQSKVNFPDRTQGYNERRDFTMNLSEGTHDIIVEHIIYRDTGSWDLGYTKYLNFVIEQGADNTPPKIITQGFYNSEFYEPDMPFFVTKCDEECSLTVDYGLTASYGQKMEVDLDEPSPLPYFRFPALTPSATYHYRVTVSDVLGNSRVLPDQTFTVQDTIPPQKIFMTISKTSSTALRLTFRAPGEDAKWGTASSYDLRYSTSPITIYNWGSATKITGVPAPISAGTTQNIDLTGFPSGTKYYFGIKAIDNDGNESLLSNIVSDPKGDEVMDLDGDGYGVGSSTGGDCDGYDASLTRVSSIYTSGYCISKFLLPVGPDQIPPQLTKLQPTGSLPAGTTQAIISLETNEIASCRYAVVPGVQYELMTLFITTGWMSHSTTVSDLSDGESYKYYIKCQDAAAPPNTNADDTLIEFKISGSSDSDNPSNQSPYKYMVTGGCKIAAAGQNSGAIFFIFVIFVEIFILAFKNKNTFPSKRS